MFIETNEKELYESRAYGNSFARASEIFTKTAFSFMLSNFFFVLVFCRLYSCFIYVSKVVACGEGMFCFILNRGGVSSGSS
jgi:hypothetical protein